MYRIEDGKLMNFPCIFMATNVSNGIHREYKLKRKKTFLILILLMTIGKWEDESSLPSWVNDDLRIQLKKNDKKIILNTQWKIPL